eukprot:6202623-Pleurochrysis_carterae.AAC.3
MLAQSVFLHFLVDDSEIRCSYYDCRHSCRTCLLPVYGSRHATFCIPASISQARFLVVTPGSNWSKLLSELMSVLWNTSACAAMPGGTSGDGGSGSRGDCTEVVSVGKPRTRLRNETERRAWELANVLRDAPVAAAR